MTLRDQITKAEILWSMKIGDLSFASSNGLTILYKSMFHGCVADQFTLGPSKVSYLIADGLAPYLKAKLCEDLKKSEGWFTIQFDETANSRVEKHCDILVRYWSDTDNLVRVRFLKPVRFGHPKGTDVAKELINTLQEPGYQLPFAKLISITSDGPNVNKTIWHNVIEWTKEAGYHAQCTWCMLLLERNF